MSALEGGEIVQRYFLGGELEGGSLVAETPAAAPLAGGETPAAPLAGGEIEALEGGEGELEGGKKGKCPKVKRAHPLGKNRPNKNRFKVNKWGRVVSADASEAQHHRSGGMSPGIGRWRAAKKAAGYEHTDPRKLKRGSPEHTKIMEMMRGEGSPKRRRYIRKEGKVVEARLRRARGE